jgi:catechol 2,3-dioxygenase-like lactoylglutathione lyase family enzyme
MGDRRRHRRGELTVITAAHTVIFSPEPEAARAFFRDVVGFDSVDAGGGWLIFTLPPGEMGVHPSGGETRHELYLMCDDITKTVAELRAKGAGFDDDGAVTDAGFGLLATMRIPGGGTVGVYEPRHPTAV